MKRILLLMLILVLTAQPVSAMDFTAPSVPEQGSDFMPADPETFGEGLWYVVKKAIAALRPEFAEASGNCMGLIAIALLCSFSSGFGETAQRTADLVGAIAVGCLLLEPSNSLINLGIRTVEEVSRYGKLLLPVMTGALAAQGGVTTSAALYTGSAFLIAFLSAVATGLLVPMLWIFLCLCVGCNITGESMLKNLRALVKWLMTWTLKIILYVFTGYMGITGVISGSADAAALKATKLTISGVVPVVGGILSDASEAILVGAGVMKSAAGIYGLLAIISICAGPFLKIGTQYLLLKAVTGICSVFEAKKAVQMIRDFCGVLGFILAMTGTVCLLLLISTVCFMKGMN